ncbi:hypothetical protein O1L60_01030 [Streptomyces diastatochromogenes]|nr:hypothetical protein [Streptomyces diastatochromogenes]
MPEMWNRDEGHDARFVDRFRDGHALVGRDGSSPRSGTPSPGTGSSP